MPVDNKMTAQTTVDNKELAVGKPLEKDELKAGTPVDKIEPKAEMAMSANGQKQGRAVGNNNLQLRRLVDKDELKNSWKLARLKLRSEFSRGVRYLGIILGVLLLLSLISGVIWLFTPNSTPEFYSFMDMSFWLPFGVVIGLIIVAAGYVNNNKSYEVYPQTNTSRFLSTQVLYYAFVVFIAAALLVIYLIQYAVAAPIALGQENTTLPYVFDPVFLIAGLLVLIVGLSLAVAHISLVAALIRKFKIYAIAAFVVMLAVLYARGEYSLGLVSTVFSFLGSESSVILFLIKGIVLWAGLFTLTYVINRHTVYYRSVAPSKNFITQIVATSVVVALITGGTTLLAKPVTLNQLLGGGGSNLGWMVEYQCEEFDISDLPNGSSIRIVTSGNIAIPGASNSSNVIGTYQDDYQTTVYFEDGTSQTFPSHYLQVGCFFDPNSVNGNKLVVWYNPPVIYTATQVMINPANARLEARLEGTTLYLDYTYDKNVKLVFVPTWTFMGQFDYFIGKDVFQETLFQSRGEVGGSAYIEVR